MLLSYLSNNNLEGLKLSYSYSDNESTLLRELISEFVFCPKCGAKNNFSSASPTQTSFFCQRCSTKISDYWESYQRGKMQIVGCELCGQQTFGSLKYCISCGEIKEKVAQIRSEKIAEQVTTRKSRLSSFQLRIGFFVNLIVFIAFCILLIVSSIGSYVVDQILLIISIVALSFSTIIFGFFIFLFFRNIRKAKI